MYADRNCLLEDYVLLKSTIRVSADDSSVHEVRRILMHGKRNSERWKDVYVPMVRRHGVG